MSDIFKSKGAKRTIGLLLLLASQAATFYPPLAPAIPILQGLGTLFGVTGLAHAAAAGTLLPKK